MELLRAACKFDPSPSLGKDIILLERERQRAQPLVQGGQGQPYCPNQSFPTGPGHPRQMAASEHELMTESNSCSECRDCWVAPQAFSLFDNA